MSIELPDLLCDSHILIVDDEGGTCAALQSVLENYGTKKVVYAADNLDAFDKLENFIPDLIIIYISSTNSGWLEFCTSLRKRNEVSNIVPILAITDMLRSDERVKIIKFNVTGVVHRPIADEKLYRSLNLHLQKSRLIKRLEESKEPTPADLEIARNMQYTLLPNEDLLDACKENYGIEISHIYQSSQALGGDYWAVKQLENSRMMVCIADFAGHGVSAAIDTFRLHNYLMEYVDYANSPATILKDMNDNFYRMLPIGQYLTCFLGIIDTENNTITYAGAAVPPAILINNQEITSLDCSGTPIGAYPKAEYTAQTINFSEGSTMLIYSDALIEINGDNKSIFTKDSLLEYIQEWSRDSMQTIYDKILTRIKQAGHRFDDDLTLVMLNINSKR